MARRQTMTGVTRAVLAGLSGDQLPPCLSLYQPTNRHDPDKQQDPIRFRNLVRELGATLRREYPAADAGLLLQPFEALAEDPEFWRHPLDGLAVLGGTGIFRVLRIPQRVPEVAAVTDRFHTKPLRRFLQSADRYQVLGLSLDGIRLFEGNRHALDELELLPGVPRTMTAALGEELTEPHQTVASYGGVGGPGGRMHHGHGGRAEGAEIDADRFFRIIDRTVLEHYSRPSRLPLILAALPEHHHRFHQSSQNPYLVADGVRFNPDSVAIDELRALAWAAIVPRYQARLVSLCDEFEQARSNKVGSDDPVHVARAATAGRVATLLIEADRRIAGQLDGTTGRIDLAGRRDLHFDDLLDELGELVASKGGAVLMIPPGQMPSRTGMAAIYRY